MASLRAAFTVTIETKPNGDYYFDQADLVRNVTPWIEGGLDDRDDLRTVVVAEQLVVDEAPAPRWALLCRQGQTAWTLIEEYGPDERPQAAAALEHRRAAFPAIEYQLAQATTVYTADGEQL